MQKIKDEQQFNRIIAESQVTMAIFKTTWCKDCHFIEPFMPQLIEQYAGRLRMIELDRDDFPDLCEKLNILGIPSFIAFHQGQELVRFVSKLRKTREEIEQFFDRSLLVAGSLNKQ
jgi:thioredoxin-like negative regulator of GroEL